jgi:hypothetical protein
VERLVDRAAPAPATAPALCRGGASSSGEHVGRRRDGEGGVLFETAAGEGGELEARPSEAVRRFMAQRAALREELHAAGVELELGPETELSYLSRFLIATNGSVERGVKQIAEHQAYMRATQMRHMHLLSGRELLGGKCDPLDVDEFYPLYIRGHDRFGHPVAYSKAGRIQIKSIFKLVEEPAFVRYHSWLRQRMMWMRDLNVQARAAACGAGAGDEADFNPCQTQYTVVIDFDGASVSQVTGEIMQVFKQVMHIDQTFHPERMFRSIFIHTPFVFHTVWRLIKGFLDKDTVAKLRIVRSDFAEALSEVVDMAEVPQEYGGAGPPLGKADHVSVVTEHFFPAAQGAGHWGGSRARGGPSEGSG